MLTLAFLHVSKWAADPYEYNLIFPFVGFPNVQSPVALFLSPSHFYKNGPFNIYIKVKKYRIYRKCNVYCVYKVLASFLIVILYFAFFLWAGVWHACQCFLLGIKEVFKTKTLYHLK